MSEPTPSNNGNDVEPLKGVVLSSEEAAGAGSCNSKAAVAVEPLETGAVDGRPGSNQAKLEPLEGACGEEATGSTKSKIELAHEFRMDAVLSPEPLAEYFYCVVCGCPAGKDTFVCKVNGHPVCRLCQSELKIVECPYMCRDTDGKLFICKSIVYQFPSVFRKFMCDEVLVTCAFVPKGCKKAGQWEAIRVHQETCEFANK